MASSSDHVSFKEGDRARCTFGFCHKSEFGKIKLLKDEVVEIVSTFSKKQDLVLVRFEEEEALFPLKYLELLQEPNASSPDLINLSEDIGTTGFSSNSDVISDQLFPNTGDIEPSDLNIVKERPALPKDFFETLSAVLKPPTPKQQEVQVVTSPTTVIPLPPSPPPIQVSPSTPLQPMAGLLAAVQTPNLKPITVPDMDEGYSGDEDAIVKKSLLQTELERRVTEREINYKIDEKVNQQKIVKNKSPILEDTVLQKRIQAQRAKADGAQACEDMDAIIAKNKKGVNHANQENIGIPRNLKRPKETVSKGEVQKKDAVKQIDFRGVLRKKNSNLTDDIQSSDTGSVTKIEQVKNTISEKPIPTTKPRIPNAKNCLKAEPVMPKAVDLGQVNENANAPDNPTTFRTVERVSVENVGIPSLTNNSTSSSPPVPPLFPVFPVKEIEIKSIKIGEDSPPKNCEDERSTLLAQIRTGIQLHITDGKPRIKTNIPTDLMNAIKYRRSKVVQSSDESGDDEDKWN